MHSSDETGDERKRLATTGGAAAEGDSTTLPAHAFRERIRRASVAAAHAPTPSTPSEVSGTASPQAADVTGQMPALLAPEQSGVHDRKSDEPAEAEVTKASSKGESSAPFSSARPLEAQAPGNGDRGRTGSVAIAPNAFVGPVSSVNAVSAASGVHRPTPRAWPFAGGARAVGQRDERRPQYHTQLGLGIPQRSAAAGPGTGAVNAAGAESAQSVAADQESDSEVSDARRRMDTRDTKRSGGAASGPAAHKITPARPFRSHDAAKSKWSPTSTKPQRASRLRGEAPKQDEPPFAQTIKHGTREPAEIVETVGTSGNASGEPYSLSELAEEYLEVSLDAHGLSISAVEGPDASESEAEARDHLAAASSSATQADAPTDEAARARRYTPKQRPTQRRGRGHERSPNHGMPAPVKDERAEHTRTVPDSRPALTLPPPPPSGRPAGQLNAHAKPGPQSHSLPPALPVVTPDTPTQPRGRPVPGLPPVAPPPAFSATKPPFGQPSAFTNLRPRESGFPQPRSPFPPAVTQRRDAPEPHASLGGARHEATIVVDPALNAPFTAPPVNHRKRATSPVHQPYQPLPSDPAAFEQLMREQAAARGSRLNWKQQATLVIPRDSLGAPDEKRLVTPKMIFGFVGATLVGALIMLGIGQYADPASSLRRVATDTSTSAAHNAASNLTVIATEPSGAELLLDGAVVGNTPLEVVRPPRGQTELTYVIRLRGFTQELIRLTSESQAAIRVTLSPETGVP